MPDRVRKDVDKLNTIRQSLINQQGNNDINTKEASNGSTLLYNIN